jgi:sugar phosphate isomerase/epimerase
MQSLNPMEVGVMFWAGADVGASIRQAKAAGVRCGQLGIPPEKRLAGAAGEWRRALESEEFTIVTVFAAFQGESYADIPTVRRTVGFVPPAWRAAREERTLEISDFAASIGTGSIACHIGCVPEDVADPDYLAVRDMVRRVARHAAGHGQIFALETGQEPAGVLARFIEDVALDNVRINFDPANMILYDMDEPLEALRKLVRHVRQVHVKDANRTTVPGQWGEEVVVGTGQVDWVAFVRILAEANYAGDYVFEREAGADRVGDILKGSTALKAAMQQVAAQA